MTKTKEQIELAIGYRIRALQIEWRALELAVGAHRLSALTTAALVPKPVLRGVSFVPAHGMLEMEALIWRARAEIVMAGYDSYDERDACDACLELLRSSDASAEEARQIAMRHGLYT